MTSVTNITDVTIRTKTGSTLSRCPTVAQSIIGKRLGIHLRVKFSGITASYSNHLRLVSVEEIN